MHTRRLITLLLGAWFAMVVTVVIVASTAFQLPGSTSLFTPAEASRALALIGEPMTSKLFHYVAAEMSRALLEKSGPVEIALLFVLASFLFLQNYNKLATILSGTLLVAAIASYFLLTPQIIVQGRLLDFQSSGNMTQERSRLSNITMMYGTLITFRLACGAWIAGLLLYRGPNSRMRRLRDNVDPIDNTQNSQIDG